VVIGGGKVDKFLLFLMDTIYTLPGLLLSITLAFILGRGILNVAIALHTYNSLALS
jgi:peptide/nickel transport system permease protein